MRGLAIFLLIFVLFAGCESTKKIDNPVVGPPPPRLPPEKIRANQTASLATTEAPDTTTRDNPSVLQQVSAQEIDFPDNMIVATVNDQPVFVGDVLAPFGEYLANVKQQAPPAEFKRLRREMLRKFLSGAIEQQILIQELHASLKKQERENLDKQLEGEWQKHVDQLLDKYKVNTRPELEQVYAQIGKDLNTEKSGFLRMITAQQCVSYKTKDSHKFEPTRKEILDYYEKHREDYAIKARVRWQQLVIDDADHGGEEGARKVVDQAVKELLANADFTETIKKHGNKARAANGGLRDWTEQGALADAEVEKQLWELPIGDLSPVIRTKSNFQIVMVIEREDAGYKAFEDLQKEIVLQLKKEHMLKLSQEIVEKLRNSVTIKTVFDTLDEQGAGRMTGPGGVEF